MIPGVCVCCSPLRMKWMNDNLVFWMFYVIPTVYYCFIYIGSNSSNFMVDAGSYLEFCAESSSVLKRLRTCANILLNWTAVRCSLSVASERLVFVGSRLLLGRRWQKNQAVLGLSTGRDAENLKLSSTTESKSHFWGNLFSKLSSLATLFRGTEIHRSHLPSGCWFGHLPSTIFWVNFMSLLDLCVFPWLMRYTARMTFLVMFVSPSEAVDLQKLIFLKCKTSLCQRPGNRGNVPVLPVFFVGHCRQSIHLRRKKPWNG